MNFLLKTTYLFEKHKLITTNTYMKEDYLTEKKWNRPQKNTVSLYM